MEQNQNAEAQQQTGDQIDETEGETIVDFLPQSDYLGVAVGGPMDVRRVAASIVLFKKRELDDRAKVAIDFIARWGMVAAIPDGFDNAGRQKLRLATEQELIVRAVSTVGSLFDTMEDMGWVVELPDQSAMMQGGAVGEDGALTGAMTSPRGQTAMGGTPLPEIDSDALVAGQHGSIGAGPVDAGPMNASVAPDTDAKGNDHANP